MSERTGLYFLITLRIPQGHENKYRVPQKKTKLIYIKWTGVGGN